MIRIINSYRSGHVVLVILIFIVFFFAFQNITGKNRNPSIVVMYDKSTDENIDKKVNAERPLEDYIKDTVVQSVDGHNDVKVVERKRNRYVNVYDEEMTVRELNASGILLGCLDKLHVFKGTQIICLYNKNHDKRVSQMILNTGQYEQKNIDVVQGILDEDPKMEYMDIGCNIGDFVITVASYGRRVLALDANIQNIRMVDQSLRLNGIRDRVTLVWNALGDRIDNMTLKLTAGVPAITEVKDATKEKIQKGENIVSSTTLDHLASFFGDNPVLIHMDIEGFEWRAFKAASKFFDTVHVRYILIEWSWYQRNLSPQRGHEIANFLTERSFAPYNHLKNREPLSLSDYNNGYVKWPKDVLWVKK